jgi:hypothetical protein
MHKQDIITKDSVSLKYLTLNFKDITFLLHLSSLYINTDECWSKAISRIFVWLKNLYFYCLDFYCYWLLDIIGDQCFFCCWLTRHKTVLTVTINNLCNCASLKCEKKRFFVNVFVADWIWGLHFIIVWLCIWWCTMAEISIIEFQPKTLIIYYCMSFMYSALHQLAINTVKSTWSIRVDLPLSICQSMMMVDCGLSWPRQFRDVQVFLT